MNTSTTKGDVHEGQMQNNTADPSDEPASMLLERIRAERAAQTAKKKLLGRKIKEPRQ